MKNYKWLKKRSSKYHNNDNELAFIAVPPINELENFIKEHMTTVDRCLTLHSNYYVSGWPESKLSENECMEIISLLMVLFLKYRPWQFHTVIQNDSAFELSWTEIDEWLYKYK